MKQSHFLLCLLLICHGTNLAQNIGINLTNPLKKLSINGSLLIDQQNKNYGGVDSAALRFGTQALVGISSNQSGFGINKYGLDLWTNNVNRLSITNAGFIGINNNNPQYQLDVYGNTRMLGTLTATESITSTLGISAGTFLYSSGDVIANDDLFAYDDLSVTGNGYFGGYMGIGTLPASNYRLNVNGNMLVQTNLGVNGTARIDGKITNEGKGIVKSNTNNTLRTGFASGTFTLSLSAGTGTDITFCIPSFTGNNSDVRVMVAQLVPGSGATGNWGAITMTTHSVNASDPACGGGSSCKVRFQNAGSSNANMGTNATLYLLVTAID